MIYNNKNKTQQIWIKGKQVLYLYHNGKLVYNVYAIPETNKIEFDANNIESITVNIKSNTNYKINI